MKLEGEIWELELIPQLVELGSQAFTGAIRFENDSVIKIVYFKEGNILSASTNDRADSIDEILLKSGKVTRDHVKQALSKRKETETLGDALLGLGFIAKRELAWARRVQLIGILRSISEWKTGSFTVVADYLPKREEGTIFPLPQVVLELVLTDQDRAKYDRLLESGSVVFRKSAAFDASFSSLGLNQEAAGIATKIDGVLSAAEVASESGSDAFNVYKLLNALNLLGLVEKTEKLHEVSPAPMESIGSFGEPASPTVEMALNFGGAGTGAAMESLESFGARSASPDETGAPEFESDSSVPADDLMGYDFDAPAAEQAEDLGINYSEPAVPASTPARSLPGRESDGLGSLESLRNFEVPAAQFPPIEDRIAQRQAKSKPLTAPPARGGRRTGLIAAVAIAVIALGAAGGWYFFRSTGTQDPVTDAAPAPAPAVATSSAPAVAPATPSPATSGGETSIAVPVPATSTAAAVPASAAVGTTTASAAEAQPVQAAAKEPSRPAATLPAKSPAATPATAPVAAAAPKSSAASSKYAVQAQQYLKEASSVPYTVQFELVCKDASVQKAIDVGGSKIWFLPITYRGEQCYRVFWGRYANRSDAERATGEIPSSLRGGKPSVISPGASR